MTDVSEHPADSYRDDRLRHALTIADDACRVLGGLRANLEAAISPTGSGDDRAGGTFCARRNARMITPEFLANLRELACTVESWANADAFGWTIDSPDAARMEATR